MKIKGTPYLEAGSIFITRENFNTWRVRFDFFNKLNKVMVVKTKTLQYKLTTRQKELFMKFVFGGSTQANFAETNIKKLPFDILDFELIPEKTKFLDNWMKRVILN